jgi:four helix bundle protein
MYVREVARRLEELPIFAKAVSFCRAITALLGRPSFRHHRKLAEQIEAANDSILANMVEGFEQPTDRALKNFLYVAKASAAEVIVRLKNAERRGWITLEELEASRKSGEELQRMLGGWIKYLAQSDWKDRGIRLRDS